VLANDGGVRMIEKRVIGIRKAKKPKDRVPYIFEVYEDGKYIGMIGEKDGKWTAGWNGLFDYTYVDDASAIKHLQARWASKQ